MIGNINPRNSCHLNYLQTLQADRCQIFYFISIWNGKKSLALTLLMPRVLADDSHRPLPFQNFAVPADFLN
jgi:hypothetical protein